MRQNGKADCPNAFGKRTTPNRQGRETPETRGFDGRPGSLTLWQKRSSKQTASHRLVPITEASRWAGGLDRDDGFNNTIPVNGSCGDQPRITDSQFRGPSVELQFHRPLQQVADGLVVSSGRLAEAARTFLPASKGDVLSRREVNLSHRTLFGIRRRLDLWNVHWSTNYKMTGTKCLLDTTKGRDRPKSTRPVRNDGHEMRTLAFTFVSESCFNSCRNSRTA